MSNEDQPAEPPPPGIELEPLAGSPHGTGENRYGIASQHDEEPIPEKPAHVCPNCDYNLSGLTSRRCPECGEEFLLYEARWHAAEIGVGGEELRRVYRRDKILLIIGGASGLAGLLIPMICHAARALGSSTPKTWPLLPPCHLLPAIIAMILLKLHREWRWSSLACVVGVCILLSGLASLL